MKNAHLDEVLFDKFLEMLESKGIKPQGGTLVDSTFIELSQSFEANKKMRMKDETLRSIGFARAKFCCVVF